MSESIDSLKNLRQKIDLIDKDIAILFEERMSLAQKIAQLKGLTHTSTLDMKRESEKINQAAKLVKPENKTQFQALLYLIMNASRERQNAFLRNDVTNDKTKTELPILNSTNKKLQLTVLFNSSFCSINQIVNRFSILGYEVISFNCCEITSTDLLKDFDSKDIHKAQIVVKNDSNAFNLSQLISTSSDILLSITVDNYAQ